MKPYRQGCIQHRRAGVRQRYRSFGTKITTSFIGRETFRKLCFNQPCRYGLHGSCVGICVGDEGLVSGALVLLLRRSSRHVYVALGEEERRPVGHLFGCTIVLLLALRVFLLLCCWLTRCGTRPAVTSGHL